MRERCRPSKKRKFDDGGSKMNESSEVQEPVLNTLPHYEDSIKDSKARPALLLHSENHGGRAVLLRDLSISSRIVFNPQPDQSVLELITPSSPTACISPRRYRIPPNASFCLADIDSRSARAFSEEISAFSGAYPSSSHITQGRFDFILLDPPWPNRSVKRSDQYLTKTHSNIMESFNDVLGNHISPNGLVACWITNKASTREVALEAFKNWGVELMEEWIWVKVTVKGETVYDVDGLWRKPFEIALLGQKCNDAGRTPSRVQELNETKKRLIAGVPDLHSRKPCLRTMVESMMQDPHKYSALEVFARNLNHGWCSWGNEVLKFNWTGHWI